MRRSVQFPLHTESENKYRRQHWSVSARKTAKQRLDVSRCLTQLPRPRLHLDVQPNTFTVTLTRIFVGTLDDDNLRGALKGVRDEVAAWIGLDDRDARIRWVYGQITCERGRWAVKIEVQDEEGGDDLERVLGDAPRTLRAPSADRLRGAKGEKRRPSRAEKGKRPAIVEAPLVQERIRFRVAYALLPWEQDGGDPVIVELPIGCDDGDPPPSLQVNAPPSTTRPAGSARLELHETARVVLYRHPYRLEEESCWLYTTDPPESGGGGTRP